MKKLVSFAAVTFFGLLISGSAIASYHAGCFLIAKATWVSKACARKSKPKTKHVTCSLKLKVVAIGKQYGLGQNHCTRKKMLDKIFWARNLKSGVSGLTNRVPKKRGRFKGSSLRSKIGYTTVQKNTLLHVHYIYSDGSHPRGVVQHESWNILRSYTPNQSEPKKKRSKAIKPTVVKSTKPVPIPLAIPKK